MQRVVGQAGENFYFGKKLSRALEDVVEQKLVIHHGAEHRIT
jgi:hypothetical protein